MWFALFLGLILAGHPASAGVRAAKEVFYSVSGCGVGYPVSITYRGGGGETSSTSSETPWVRSPEDAPIYYVSAQKQTEETCTIDVSIYTARVTLPELQKILLGGNSGWVFLLKIGTQVKAASSDSPYGVASASWAPSMEAGDE